MSSKKKNSGGKAPTGEAKKNKKKSSASDDDALLEAALVAAESAKPEQEAKEKKQQQRKKDRAQQAKLLGAVKAYRVEEVLQILESDISAIKLPQSVHGHTDAVGWLLCQRPPPLLLAARLELHQVIGLLLENPSIDVNVEDKEGDTALHLASQGARHQVVKLLLAHPGIDVNVKGTGGWTGTALSLASQEGHHQVVELLLAHSNIDVTVKELHGFAALHEASQAGHHQVVELLLAHPSIGQALASADVNATTNQDGTALHLASQNGHHQVVKLLLAHSGIEVNAKDTQEGTALHHASQNGHHQVVELLLAHPSIEVNATDTQGGTALHDASLEGHHKVVELLLAHSGIEVNVKNNQGMAALHDASQNGHHGVVWQLLAHPTTDATARHTGPTESLSSWLRELLNSVRSKHWEKAKELLDDPQSTTPSWTALHDAASEGHPAVIHVLLLASPGLVNEALANNGRTALHIAANFGHLGAVMKLLSQGADANLETTFSKCTPLQMAAEAGHLKVTHVLLEFTSRLHIHRALLWAIQEGQEDVAMVLRDRAGVDVTTQWIHPPRFIVLDNEDKLGAHRCCLGKGGFGVVHKGIDCRDGNLIAVKRALTQDERYKKPAPGESEKIPKATEALSVKLEEEFHLHESLRHVNIVPVYRKRLDDDGKYWCIHMRLMNGQTVESKAKGSGLRDQAHIRRCLFDALQGLRYLHNKQVCHFDIKPGNMLLDDNNNNDNDRLLLSDFGLSREGFDKTDNPGGTRYYKAPEIVNKTGEYGPGTDIWALACSVIYMATGKHPWTASSPRLSLIQVEEELKEGKHPPLRNSGVLLPGISPSLEDLLEKMFQHDQKARFSANECLFHPFVTGTPFTAAPVDSRVIPHNQQHAAKPAAVATAGGGGLTAPAESGRSSSRGGDALSSV